MKEDSENLKMTFDFLRKLSSRKFKGLLLVHVRDGGVIGIKKGHFELCQEWEDTKKQYGK